jgi:hypothetical protein
MAVEFIAAAAIFSGGLEGSTKSEKSLNKKANKRTTSCPGLCLDFYSKILKTIRHFKQRFQRDIGN